MAKSFKKGDRETSQGETHGKVVKKQASRTHIKGYKVAASKEDPQYIVQSEKRARRRHTSWTNGKRSPDR